MLGSDVVGRLKGMDVSALCDAAKDLPVVDPAIRAMVPDVRMAGRAFTVVAEDDHLPVMSAVAEAAPGDVLVVTTNGGSCAVLGELFANEARRRGLAGVVIDGRCRDLQGLRRAGLPIFARGTTPMSGSVVARTPLERPIRCGGVDVAPGDVVFGDDDGVIIAPADRIAAALDAAEAIASAERAILEAIGQGTALHALTNYAEHVAALDRGGASALAFQIGEGSRT